MKTKTDKKSSVVWLWHNLTDDLIGELTPKQIHKIYNLVLEAEQMHKDEIIQAYREGRSDQQSVISKWYNRTSQQYFNQTFNKTTNDIE